MNDKLESINVSSKKTNFAPGDYLPSAAEFPGQTSGVILGWIIGLPVGGIVGAGLAKAFFGDTLPGSAGALVGTGLTWMILKDVQKGIMAIKGRKYYTQLAETEPQNADACVQAGLWIRNIEWSETGSILQGLFKGKNGLEPREESDAYFGKALERSPDHRDATIALAGSLSRSSNHKAVVELLEPWLDGHEDFQGEVAIAVALKALGEQEKTTIHFQRIMELHPETDPEREINRYLLNRWF